MSGTRLCEYEGCRHVHYGHGWCQTHYTRWRRYGDPSVVRERRRQYESVADRIARLSKPDGDCIVFTGGQPQRSGHRMISHNNVQAGVHRVAYELSSGPIPAGQVVMHRCDNPPCIKREHLRLGTVADNNRDRDAKGRHRPLPGSKNGNARLREWQVAEIKTRLARGESTCRLAAEYGVRQGTVWRIKSGEGWRHVKPANWLSREPAVEESPAGPRDTASAARRGSQVMLP